MAISRRLNEAEVPLKTSPRPTPNTWNKPLVLRILRNRLYLGELSSQGEFVVAEHPALIDPETFEKVQRMLEPKDRRQRHESRNPVYLVRGALKCGICGATMTSASTFRDGRLYRYYRCSTRDKKGKEGCPTVQLGAEAIERFVVERLQRLLADPGCEVPLQKCLEPLGLLTPGGKVAELWEFLSLPNQQRLVRLLVEEVVVDQRVGKLSVTLRNPADLQEAAC
jgi:hypothetical protein